MDNPTWPTIGWPLSELIQLGSLISEPTKFEPDLIQYGLVD